MVKKTGLPRVGENVLVTVKSITPNSALCSLDEYQCEGMIHVSEVSGKWVKDIKKYVKVGKQYVAKAINVDESKCFVLLSLKRLSKKEKEQKMEKFKKGQKSEKILEFFAKKKGISLEKAYELVGFKLQEIYGDLYEGFEYAIKQPDHLIRNGISEQLVKEIAEAAQEFIKKKEVEIKIEITLKFLGENGIDRIKQVLKSIKDKYNLDVKYLSAPKYLVQIKTNNPKQVQKDISKALTEEFAKIKDGEASFQIIGRENE
ncbi:MAG: S1 RNA-binding domain-containing protein [Candidatus Aenigmatarchaeota archaeon]|nr:S1 RNA-binding domain-containing protein [Candidatus Aenigmarchaeota archaeon]